MLARRLRARNERLRKLRSLSKETFVPSKSDLRLRTPRSRARSGASYAASDAPGHAPSYAPRDTASDAASDPSCGATGIRTDFAGRSFRRNRCAGYDCFLGCIQSADQRFLLDRHVGLLGFSLEDLELPANAMECGTRHAKRQTGTCGYLVV